MYKTGSLECTQSETIQFKIENSYFKNIKYFNTFSIFRTTLVYQL